MTERTLAAVPPFQDGTTPEPTSAASAPAETTALAEPEGPRTITINAGDMERVTKHLAGIPDFEGKEVEFTAAKIVSVGALEVDDMVWRIDDYVRMVVECRVLKVGHDVNEKTGKLVRVHTLKAIDTKVLKSWDEPAE
jgi:hypothetical protein